jgi:hypothetical protein
MSQNKFIQERYAVVSTKQKIQDIKDFFNFHFVKSTSPINQSIRKTNVTRRHPMKSIFSENEQTNISVFACKMFNRDEKHNYPLVNSS